MNDFEKGMLISLDGNMNIAMEQCKEMKNEVEIEDYGDAFIRGNNGKVDGLWKCVILINIRNDSFSRFSSFPRCCF